MNDEMERLAGDMCQSNWTIRALCARFAGSVVKRIQKVEGRLDKLSPEEGPTIKHALKADVAADLSDGTCHDYVLDTDTHCWVRVEGYPDLFIEVREGHLRVVACHPLAEQEDYATFRVGPV